MFVFYLIVRYSTDMRLCPICKLMVSVDLFYKRKGKPGGYCKSCQSDKAKRKYKQNPEPAKARSKRASPEKKKALARKYYIKNQLKRIQQVKDYVANNRDKSNAYRRQYQKDKLKSDPSYRLARYGRKRRWEALNEQGAIKAGKYEELLGCSVEDFKKHLESQFEEGMTWDNYGTYWHVDEIIPCAAFDLSLAEHQRACWHYSNSRPLVASENMSRGGQKLHLKEDWSERIYAQLTST